MAGPFKAAHRHGIENLIGHDQTTESRYKPIRPAKPSRALNRHVRDGLLLTRAQIRTQLDHLHIDHQPLPPGGLDEACREIAASAAKLADAPDVTGTTQGCRPTVDGIAQPWPKHGRRDEIALRTERHATSGVIARPRRVERGLHEGIKADPTPRVMDHAMDMGRERRHGPQVIKATLRPMPRSDADSLHPPTDTAPKAALVTGAAVRLGRTIALRLAADGWDLALHYRHSIAQAQALARDITSMGRQCVCVQADLGEPDEVRSLFTEVCNHLPHLRCIVNNASRFEFDRPEDVQPETLIAHHRDNLVGPVLLSRMLFARLSPQHVVGQDPLGVIIHILDQKLANPNPDFFSYTLSKASLLEATRLCAQAFAPSLRVLAVAPGITLPSGDQTAEEFAITHGMTPLGASSRPQEVADAVAWLAQARAVTGTMLLVDGGQHMAAQPRDIMMMVRS